MHMQIPLPPQSGIVFVEVLKQHDALPGQYLCAILPASSSITPPVEQVWPEPHEGLLRITPPV